MTRDLMSWAAPILAAALLVSVGWYAGAASCPVAAITTASATPAFANFIPPKP